MGLKEHFEIKEAKLPSRSYVKNPSEKIAYARLRTLELAESLKNVSEACRRGGMDRASFYEWKRRYQIHGLEGLMDLPPVHKTHAQTTPPHVVEAILDLSLANPGWGCKRLDAELRRQGMLVSHTSVQRVLRGANRHKRMLRFMALEQSALEGFKLDQEQLRLLEKLNPCLKERHVESASPGALVCQDTFYVGHFKGIGKVHLQTAVDTFGSYAFGMLSTERNATRAAELLYAHVSPFYASHGLTLIAVLTDNGTEFCGTETHPFEQLLWLEGIEHRRTRVKRPQTNGFVERFHRTILEEFFRVELRKKIYASLEELEEDLQTWLVHYNTNRAHLGYRNNGATPYETVLKFVEAERQEA